MTDTYQKSALRPAAQGGHSILGASSLDQREACPGSAVLEQDVPRSTTRYAAEGTAAHELAAWCLTKGKGPAERLGDVIEADGYTFTVDVEMAEAVQEYVDRCRAYLVDPSDTMLVEQSLAIGWLVNLPGDTSTADVVIFQPTQKRIIVRDLKYGKGVPVDAMSTLQPVAYGIAALREFDLIMSEDEVDEIVVEIDQPRLNSVSRRVIPINEVPELTARITRIADRCHEAAAMFDHATAIGADDSWVEKYLQVSDKGCKFCSVKSRCPKFEAEVQGTIAMQFDEVAAVVAEQGPTEARKKLVSNARRLTIYEVDHAMHVIDAIEDWCAAVREAAYRTLEQGGKLPGFKLVEGRAGARKWASEQEAEKTLRSLRLKVDEIYDSKVKSPTQIEKLLAKEHPRQWAKVEPLVVRPESKPVLAPADDKRKEWRPVAQQFDAEVTDNDSLV